MLLRKYNHFLDNLFLSQPFIYKAKDIAEIVGEIFLMYSYIFRRDLYTNIEILRLFSAHLGAKVLFLP